MASFSKLDKRFRPAAEWLFHVAQYNNLRPRLTSAYRSIDHQKRLYAEYTAGRHPYPVAPPGRSMHNYGLAIDMVSSNNAALGAYWESLGGRWGGARDPVHFGVRT